MLPILLTEPPHPWLLPLLALLVLVEVGSVLGKRQFCAGPARQIKALTIRKVDVMVKMSRLGIPTDFVKKSKLERELIAIDKDLAPRKEELTRLAAQYDGLASKGKYAVYLLLVLCFWGTPLLRLSPSATWPLTSFFSFPRLGPGAVGVSAAIAMVKGVTAPFVPWIASV